MPSFSFVVLTIFSTGLVTWLSRIMPFWILRKVKLSPKVIEFLSFVPIVIMSALWFENLFHQNVGYLPTVDWPNLFASVPTVISAIISRSLLVVVVVGVISLAVIRMYF
ncbi:AzlD domain-containing protein [Companilactobacillus ginsenosidimutans]|uniref:Branched-chain amino acid ABC transporter n=1 Tax=Companilactobacillus ginsenosidimutans TaxID=1007676 RepID=A0A0H4QKC1_9LACO|nr:AzlD domain-containing protein [Companilactobacillus ginsenosidimutans]AKP67143.1 branched-chain amino acid ABC transporter [Companilactobacillus ginsenosidimutans]